MADAALFRVPSDGKTIKSGKAGTQPEAVKCVVLSAFAMVHPWL